MRLRLELYVHVEDFVDDGGHVVVTVLGLVSRPYLTGKLLGLSGVLNLGGVGAQVPFPMAGGDGVERLQRRSPRRGTLKWGMPAGLCGEAGLMCLRY